VTRVLTVMLGLVLVAAPLTAQAPAIPDWVVPAGEKARPNPVPASPAALTKGRALYQRHCASCHGDKGKGDGNAARFGVKAAEDLTDAARQKSFTDGEAFWKISTGRKLGADVVMPGFADTISSDEDRWKLVLFVRSLAAKRTEPRD
jgi:mono/diheme cytochrome c family protein